MLNFRNASHEEETEMNKSDALVIKKSDLPISVVLTGDQGEQEYYALVPAGKKFGACLQKVTGIFRDRLM